MRYTYYFILFFISISLLSCKQDEDSNLVAFSTVYGIDDYERAKEELKNYALFGVYTDGVSKLYLERSEGIGENPTGYILTTYRPDPSSSHGDGGIFYVNDIKNVYQTDQVSGFYAPEVSTDLSDPFAMGQFVETLFGQNNRFRLERNSETIYDEVIYIPEAIEINSFDNTGIAIPNTSNYGIARSNFSFSWNKNEDNPNGVLVVLTWDGNSASTPLNELAPDGYYYKAAWMEDTGSGTIPASFFDQIPQEAMFRLHFYRANFKIVEGKDGRSYKIYGMTDDWKQCVMME